MSSTVTGKIYGLKQHFLPPAIAWRFTKIKHVVLINKQVVTHKEEYHKFWKENIEDRVKLLELNFFKKLLSKGDNDRFA